MNTILLTAWLACQGLDFGTTYYALHSGRFHEGNPFLKHNTYVLKASVNVGVFIWHKHMNKDKKWIAPTIMSSIGCTAGAINLHRLVHE